MHEEEQHIDIREKLLNLPKVKAGDDFINALQRKINLADAELNQKKITEEVKESVWVKLFGKKRNPWLIPSLSLTIVAIVVISIFLFPTNKDKSITGLQESDKNKTTVESAPLTDSQEKMKKEDLPGKDIANDITPESRTGDLRSSYETNKGYTEQPGIDQVKPPVEKELNRVSEPIKTEDANIETGKTEFKKEEKINRDFEKKVTEEQVSPKEGNIKADETKSKIKDIERSEPKDNIESKGLIEKKEKMTMKKTAKSTTDSTKIDKKVLEKIKEELEKSIEEQK